MTIYLSEKEAAKAGIIKAPRAKRGRNTRPDIPSAGRSESVGLSGLIAPERDSNTPVWSYEYTVAKGHRFYVIGQPSYDTGFHLDLAAACAVARGLHHNA